MDAEAGDNYKLKNVAYDQDLSNVDYGSNKDLEYVNER